MPLFEYKCDDCGKHFEELTSDQDEKVACPECKSTNTHKLLSVFASSCGSAGGAATGCTQSGGGFT